MAARLRGNRLLRCPCCLDRGPLRLARVLYLLIGRILRLHHSTHHQHHGYHHHHPHTLLHRSPSNISIIKNFHAPVNDSLLIIKYYTSKSINPRCGSVETSFTVTLSPTSSAPLPFDAFTSIPSTC